jgi:hypothetical protein
MNALQGTVRDGRRDRLPRHRLDVELDRLPELLGCFELERGAVFGIPRVDAKDGHGYREQRNVAIRSYAPPVSCAICRASCGEPLLTPPSLTAKFVFS